MLGELGRDKLSADALVGRGYKTPSDDIAATNAETSEERHDTFPRSELVYLRWLDKPQSHVAEFLQ